MTGLIRKVLGSFTFENIRKLLQFLLKDPRGIRGKNITALSRFLLIDLKKLRTDELRRLASDHAVLKEILHRLDVHFLEDVPRELAFRELRPEFDKMNDRELELYLEALNTEKIGWMLRREPKDAVDHALRIEECLRQAHEESSQEYVIRRILQERQGSVPQKS